MSSPVPWEEFERDPRSPDLAPLRASDRDRDLALQILAEAYAEGRLDRGEFDERADAVNGARTLGELPALLGDLVPLAEIRPGTGGEHHRQRAVAKYERERRDAIWQSLSVSVICWVIWLAINRGDYDAFPWPLFPMVASMLNVGRVVYQREDIINGDIRRREKREAKALHQREKRALPPGGRDEG